jgi:transposase
MCGPLVPAVPSCILDPLREEFLALIPARVDRHPLGCHRRRIDDRVVFDKLVAGLVFGCGYERLGDRSCSATTPRRRRDEWIAAGLFDRLRRAVLAAYERLIGLDLADVSVDGCLTKAPCGGECAGRSPVDRAKLGLKRSQLADGSGVPITALPAPANTRDHQLLPATLDVLTGLLQEVGAEPGETTVHLDAGYDYRPCRADVATRGLGSKISHRGNPRRCRSASAGWSSAPTPGSTTTAGCAAAPNDDAAASRPTSPWPPPSSPSALSSEPLSTATAGTPAQDHRASDDLLA